VFVASPLVLISVRLLDKAELAVGLCAQLVMDLSERVSKRVNWMDSLGEFWT
jgi:hypothetical protein